MITRLREQVKKMAGRIKVIVRVNEDYSVVCRRSARPWFEINRAAMAEVFKLAERDVMSELNVNLDLEHDDNW